MFAFLLCILAMFQLRCLSVTYCVLQCRFSAFDCIVLGHTFTLVALLWQTQILNLGCNLLTLKCAPLAGGVITSQSEGCDSSGWVVLLIRRVLVLLGATKLSTIPRDRAVTRARYKHATHINNVTNSNSHNPNHVNKHSHNDHNTTDYTKYTHKYTSVRATSSAHDRMFSCVLPLLLLFRYVLSCYCCVFYCMCSSAYDCMSAAASARLGGPSPSPSRNHIYIYIYICTYTCYSIV